MESITSEVFNLWGWSFFSKFAKLYVDWKNGIKYSENVYSFWDNGVLTCCGNFSQLWREYMWSASNVLPNSPKIADLIKRNAFYLNLSRLNGKLEWKWSRADFSSVWHPWTNWLTKSVLREKLSGIQVTIILGVNNFWSILAMKLIFFFNMR